jgi:hypothetical protein
MALAVVETIAVVTMHGANTAIIAVTVCIFVPALFTSFS